MILPSVKNHLDLFANERRQKSITRPKKKQKNIAHTNEH